MTQGNGGPTDAAQGASDKSKRPTEFEKLAQRAAIGRMYLRRIPAQQIADALEISVSTVRREIKTLKAWFQEQSEAQAKAMRESEIGHLRLVREEAWIAWEQSQQDFESKELLLREGEEKKARTMKQRTEKRIGDPRFLDLVVKTTSEIMEAYGVKLPRKFALTDRGGEKDQPLAFDATLRIDDFNIRSLVEEMRKFEDALEHDSDADAAAVEG